MSENSAESVNKPLRHIAFIMDGNRRWAKEHHLPKIMGHRKGAEVLKVLAKSAINDFGITTVSAFAFSTDNQRNRSAEERADLMNLLAEYASEQREEFMREGIRLLCSGQLDSLPEHTRSAFQGTAEQTHNNKRGTLNMCVNYGGREEIIDAVNRRLAEGPIATFTMNDLDSNLYAPDLPDVDLMVRTSGEKRTSAFMLWSGANTEYEFEDKYWPDLTVEDLARFVDIYSQRDFRQGA
ncbi:isoprenyl transferase [soil metagenome]